MSTISFPDWINSLSPQSTSGKEVYQQDGSTPSRGDLDDKASLSDLGSMSEQDSDDVDITGGNINLPSYRLNGARITGIGGFTVAGSESVSFTVPLGFRGSAKVIVTAHYQLNSGSNRIYSEWIAFRGEGADLVNSINTGSAAFGSVSVSTDGSNIVIDKSSGSSSRAFSVNIIVMGNVDQISGN